MNIAHIIPSSVCYPLATHNGRYDWVYQLATRQAREGHTVTIYGGSDSFVEGVHTVGLPTPSNDKRQNNTQLFRLAFSHDHDVYHSHFDNLHYSVAHETTRPVVYTQHWWPTDETVQAAKDARSKNVWAVPPTKFMYEHDQTAGIQSRGHIYHGIDLDVFQPSTATASYRLLFVGRISPEKNLELAMISAKKAGASFDVIGKIAPKNATYWQSLQPLIDGTTIRYLGTKNHSELIDYYTAARGVLFPSDINEPFGLVAIEAQACGTPVIMQRGGSRGELIAEGTTGFLCSNEADYASAITSLSSLSPTDCIAFAHQFDIRDMTRRYDELYAALSEN